MIALDMDDAVLDALAGENYILICLSLYEYIQSIYKSIYDANAS